MNNNNYSWNETLKFSWGHIIAFLALIFISYVCYMGDFYMNGGVFKMSAIKVLIIDVALLVTFIGAQILKGTDSKFNRSIIIERILICLCPIIFVWAMIPYNHFWYVFSQREQIENKFNTSIEKSKEMFVNYEDYANNRISAYSNLLDNAIINKSSDPVFYAKVGFNGRNDVVQKDNYLKTLRLQLISQNTDSLKNVATKWIDQANQGATVWNAFLVGNIDQIAEAISNWNQALISYSKPALSNESMAGNEIQAFDANKEAIEAATIGLTSLTDIYTSTEGIKVNTFCTGIILFMMLLFPYVLQKRNTRANGLYFLLPTNKKKSIKSKPITEKIKITEVYETPSSENISSTNNNNNDDDIFGGTF